MRRIFSKFGEWNQAIGNLVAHVDDMDFPRYLVEAINQLVVVEAVMIVLERSNETPVLLYDFGIPGKDRDLHIDKYFAGAYLLDPVCMAIEEGLESGFYHLSEVVPDDFYQSDYYRTYYQETSLIDDAYYVVETKDGTKLSLAIGRQRDKAKFSPEDLQLMRLMEPVVKSAVLHYWNRVWEARQLPEGANPQMRRQIKDAFNNFGCSILTEREREVVHLLLRGHSSKSAAQKLDISPDTVQMHRKNLYAKLDISSQSELFSLFISALTHGHAVPGEDPLVAYMSGSA